ncbi:MAG: prolipoprotein diacylglyceryl transferase [Patescibacteria group bacterium]|nr:prolipoprotein diacylglyceryl transferase [Patescibacteria group bacterium]MDD5294593.1 prolipoprotein diacylglyceryl transferase [Patescibacteria group bacterium]MDD5554091.1 prolipoprotein diacylglyceryl transferase [Patescibacteria group bacterium]
MVNFLHTFNPNPILVSFGPINIYWYGFFIVLGALAAIAVAFKISSYYSLKKEAIIDLAFWLVIGGIIGARLYHVFLEFPYYLKYPLNIFKVWQGGLAIHGAIIAGLLIIWFFAKKRNLDFWLLTAIIAPGLALAQAIGRWGNYFNGELFGKPTNLGWGIPIDIMRRPLEYISSEFFHPTFLYESIGNFLIFLILISLHIWIIGKKQFKNYSYFLIFSFYLIMYSILRFSLEFIRIDETPVIWSLRFPQIASLIIVLLTFALLIYKIRKDKLKT